MRTFYLFFFAFLVLGHTVSAQVQQLCDSTYVPAPNQDCPGAIRICSNLYETPTGALCGEGRLIDEARGTCGTQERNSSWYSFRAQSSGLLSFVIIPNDMTDTTIYTSGTAGSGNSDYDFLIYRLPAGQVQGAGFCSSLRVDSVARRNQFACNYSGERGATGLFTGRGSTDNGSFNAPILVAAGDEFVLLVDNFRITDIGYKIRFYGPQNGAQYADITTPPSLGIQYIDYDPTCTGDCPVLVTLGQPLYCADLTAQLYNPANISQSYPVTVECVPGSDFYTPTFLLRGDFNPRDTALRLVIGTQGAGSYLYQCGSFTLASDTVLLQPGYGGGYRTITDTKRPLVQALQVAPNPFMSELSVTLPGKGRYAFRLLDATGKAVLETSLQGGSSPSVRLPSTLAPGLYSAEATGEGRVLRQRLTRQ